MDSRKPLTAERIRGLRSYADACIICCEIEPDELRAMLDMLTPPPDAAVRGAVDAAESLLAQIKTGQYCAWEWPVRELLRAVQVPRLTAERMEAGRKLVELLRGQCSSCEHVDGFVERPRDNRCVCCLRNKNDSNWHPDEEFLALCAAFAGEVL